MNSFPQVGEAVCCRCVRPLGDRFVTIHRDAQAVGVCFDCATKQERREQDERRAKGLGW